MVKAAPAQMPLGAVLIHVNGVPQPQGSAKGFVPKGWTRAVLTSDNPKNKGWRGLVADEASRTMRGRKMHIGPVRMIAVFYLPRPKSLPKRQQAHLKKPDLDKLIRSVCDALTGVVWKDDSQVVQVKGEKRYAGGDEPAGAVIVVESIETGLLAPNGRRWQHLLG